MLALKKSHLFTGISLLLIPAASLFFLGGVSDVSLPIWGYLWNMGHIVFFLLLTVAISLKRPWQSMLSVFGYLGIILLVSFVIELIQRTIGRDFSTMDILRNLIGCTIALFFTSRRFLHISVYSFLGFIFVIDLAGLITTGMTDYTIQNQAPLIDNFESEFIMARWDGVIERSNRQVIEGQSGAYAQFPPGKYSGVSFNSLLRNWQGYRALELNIYNPDKSDNSITIRMHDAVHSASHTQPYDDRFNRSLTLQPGWNRIEISLKDIASAPKTRQMDLSDMTNLGLFFTDVTDTKELYFDNFRLIP